jgi:protein-S-isoprenylcysteine O-methyltransferase Ste14
MEKVRLLAVSALFLLVAPGTIAGLLPWMISGWRGRGGAPALVAGGLLMAAATVLLLESFLRFAMTAGGTAAPPVPTQRLVVTGFYRFVRNPMYVAVTSLILGQALVFASWPLAEYAVVVWIGFHIFVVGFEERRLIAQFPSDFEAYRRHVRRWIPRLTPWRTGAP